MKTAYIHSDAYASYNLGPRHPLQQTRLIDICHQLKEIDAFGTELILVEPTSCTETDVLSVHAVDYVEIVKRASAGEVGLPLSRYGLGPGDTPAFPGMWENGLLYCGGSDTCAKLVSDGHFGRAISFAGGLHHAHFDHASGFCILSDIAIAVNTLKARGFRRVMYVDIDVHHGDGVEALFRADPDVLTLSFHESGAWLFPGTGNVQDRGTGIAEESVWNVPFAPSTGGDIWCRTVSNVSTHLLETFSPDAIVLQLGADALDEDPLGHLVMTRWEWLQTVGDLLKTFGEKPVVILGGGGYCRAAVVDVWSRVALLTSGKPWQDGLQETHSVSSKDALDFYVSTMRYLSDNRGLSV
jgi:acetoin utilization protein AcuC